MPGIFLKNDQNSLNARIKWMGKLYLQEEMYNSTFHINGFRRE